MKAPEGSAPYAHLGTARTTGLKGRNNPAQGNALGIDARIARALKGRQNDLARACKVLMNGAKEVQCYFALSGLGTRRDNIPRALPWAVLFRAFQASTTSRLVVPVRCP
jgi:hypothetical protein